MAKKKIYIAGKITGDPKYRAKFKRAKERLAAYMGPILNPAELPEGMAPADYMQLCFAMIDCSDMVVFLPDYEQSKGAMLELEYCRYIGKETFILVDEEARHG
jgi:nucleoside 2-deoxyribosyltransferase